MDDKHLIFKTATVSGLFIIIGAFVGGYLQSSGQIESSELLIKQKRQEIIIENANKEFNRIVELFSNYITSVENLIDELSKFDVQSIEIQKKLSSTQIIAQKILITSNNQLSLATIKFNKSILELVAKHLVSDPNFLKNYSSAISKYGLVVKNVLDTLKLKIDDGTENQIEDRLLNKSENIIGILWAIISGVLASILVISFQYYQHKNKIKKLFKSLHGTYEHLDIHNEKLIKGHKTIIEFNGTNSLKTKGIADNENLGCWKGSIAMNEALPDFGNGFYQYDVIGSQGNESGIHTVILDRKNERIYVGINTMSHTSQKRHAIIWQKVSNKLLS